MCSCTSGLRPSLPTPAHTGSYLSQRFLIRHCLMVLKGVAALLCQSHWPVCIEGSCFPSALTHVCSRLLENGIGDTLV